MKVDDVLARYKPARKTVPVLLDGGIRAEIEETARQLKKAKRTENTDGLASKVPQLEERIRQLENDADEASVVFTLQAIPGRQFSELKLAYPPSEHQWEQFRELQKQMPLFAKAPEVDLETFTPALIGLSVCEVDGEPVEWGIEDGQKLWDQLHDGARADLMDAAWGVNGQRSARPLSETATATTQSSDDKSTTRQNEESPTPSS